MVKNVSGYSLFGVLVFGFKIIFYLQDSQMQLVEQKVAKGYGFEYSSLSLFFFFLGHLLGNSKINSLWHE